MLFEKVTKENILQGIKDFETKGFPKGFGPSSTYDVVSEGEKYPPKAIMAYANFHADGRTVENYFKGGEGVRQTLLFVSKNTIKNTPLSYLHLPFIAEQFALQ